MYVTRSDSDCDCDDSGDVSDGGNGGNDNGNGGNGGDVGDTVSDEWWDTVLLPLGVYVPKVTWCTRCIRTSNRVFTSITH